MAPLLTPLWYLDPLPFRRHSVPIPAARAQALHRKALMVEGRDGKAKESGGHGMGVTRDSTFCCLLSGKAIKVGVANRIFVIVQVPFGWHKAPSLV